MSWVPSNKRVRLRGEQPGSAAALESDRLLGVVLGFLTFAALALVVPLMILASPDYGRSTAWRITFFILLMSATRLAMLVSYGERRLFEFIFWLFCYVFFGLAPSVQIRADAMATTTANLDPVLDVPTAALALAGIVAVAVGFAVANRRGTKIPKRMREYDINRPRLILLSVIGLAMAGYYVSKVGLGTLFSSRAASSLIEEQHWPDTTVAAIVRAASSFPILIAAHGWWSMARRAENKGSARTIAAVLTAITLLVTNPISSSRYASGVVWGSFLGPLGAYSTRRRTSITMVGIVVGLLFLFPIADLFRRVTPTNAARTGFLSEYAGNGDYDAFGQLSNAILYDQTMPLQFGRQLLGLVLFWVPRSIWSDKPTGSGVLLAQFRGYNFTNLSAPIWAELLLNFGLVGVVVASVLVGVGLGRLDLTFRSANGSGTSAIAASVLPFFLLILLRGSLLQAMGTLVVIIGSLVLISGRRSNPEP
jgi:hypothetical protein